MRSPTKYGMIPNIPWGSNNSYPVFMKTKIKIIIDSH